MDENSAPRPVTIVLVGGFIALISLVGLFFSLDAVYRQLTHTALSHHGKEISFAGGYLLARISSVVLTGGLAAAGIAVCGGRRWGWYLCTGWFLLPLTAHLLFGETHSAEEDGARLLFFPFVVILFVLFVRPSVLRYFGVTEIVWWKTGAVLAGLWAFCHCCTVVVLE